MHSEGMTVHTVSSDPCAVTAAAPMHMRGSDDIAAPAIHSAGARKPTINTGEDVSRLSGVWALLQGLPSKESIS